MKRERGGAHKRKRTAFVVDTKREPAAMGSERRISRSAEDSEYCRAAAALSPGAVVSRDALVAAAAARR